MSEIDFCTEFLNSSKIDLSDFKQLISLENKNIRRIVGILAEAHEKLMKAYFYCVWFDSLMSLYNTANIGLEHFKSNVWKPDFEAKMLLIEKFLKDSRSLLGITPKNIGHIVTKKWLKFIDFVSKSARDRSLVETLKFTIDFFFYVMKNELNKPIERTHEGIQVDILASKLEEMKKCLLQALDQVNNNSSEILNEAIKILDETSRKLEDLKSITGEHCCSEICSAKYFEVGLNVIEKLEENYEQIISTLRERIKIFEAPEIKYTCSIAVDFIKHLYRKEEDSEKLCTEIVEQVEDIVSSIIKVCFPLHLLITQLLTYRCLKASYPDVMLIDFDENWEKTLLKFGEKLEKVANELESYLQTS